MSGGSMDYLCYKVQDAAKNLINDKCPKRRAFGLHLKKVSEALHDIEWVDSADKSSGDEFPAIMACVSPVDVGIEILKEADRMIKELQELKNQWACM